jgi:hypothetical protein
MCYDEFASAYLAWHWPYFEKRKKYPVPKRSERHTQINAESLYHRLLLCGAVPPLPLTSSWRGA